jgi:hypothetical protein
MQARRQLDGVILDDGGEAHAREDAGTPALRERSAIATPPVKSASPDTTICPSLLPLFPTQAAISRQVPKGSKCHACLIPGQNNLRLRVSLRMRET